MLGGCRRDQAIRTVAVPVPSITTPKPLSRVLSLSLPSLSPLSSLPIQNPRKPTSGFSQLWPAIRYLMNLISKGGKDPAHHPYLVPWAQGPWNKTLSPPSLDQGLDETVTSRVG